MPCDPRPLPIDRCPSCAVPWRGPDTECQCGAYRTPATLDDRRLVAVRETRQTLRLARRGRVLRESYERLNREHAA